MPIFESNGKKYNVQDEHIEKFGNKFPDATTIMERDGKKYRVKAKDYNTFLGDALQTGSPKETPGVAAQDVAYTAPLDSVPETQKVENVPVVEQDGVAQPQVEAPTVETEPVNADLSSLYTVKSAKEGMTFESAMNRARNRMKMDKVFDDARGMTESMFNTLNKERDRRKSQVEKDVESYNSARKWALSPYASDPYNEFAYRSAATDLRKADDLGMIEEFAKDAKTSLLNDEDFKAGATEKAEALGLTLEQYVDAVAVPMLQEKMWNEWVAPQEEKTKKNYNGLVAAAENSLLGMLLGSSRTDTEKYLSQVGQEAWRKDASLLGKAASGAGSMFLDLPAFVGLGSLASAPARYAGGQAFKHLAKNEAKKMVARGATEAAAQRYANYAVRNGLKNRVLLNLSTAPLQSGLTFGMFDAGKAALNMSLNGEWDWKELGKSAVGGALMGGALGAAGAVGGGLTHGLTGATKAAAKVAEFGVENAVFTEGGRLIGKLHGQQPENGWLEDYVESGATLLMLKAPNIVKNVSAIKGDKDASEVFAFNKLEREQLGKYGEDLNTVLESLLPKSGRLYEDGLKINEGTFPEEYRRVMSDPDVAITTKAKLMGIVEGKVMPAPRVVDAKIEGNRVMTYDPMGRLVEVKEYATEAKANAEYKKVANAAEIESIAVMEDMYVRIKGYEADDVTVREWLAKNPTVTAEDIANIIAKNSAGEKLTEGEQKILESLRKARREGLNDVRHLNGVLAELDVDPKDVMSGIEKPIDDRTEAENRAVKAYTDVLYQEIKAKVVEPFRRGEARRAEDFDTTVRLIESDRSVDETANDGMVYTTTTPSGEKIIITGGKVVLDKYGYIDVNQSEGLVVMFPDGRKKPMRPGDLREKVEVSNAEEIKAAKREEIVESARAKNEIGEPMTEPTAGASQNGNLVPGAEIEVAFDGEIYKLKVDGRDERGDVVLSGEGASMALPESVVRYAMKQAETLQAESEKVEGENEVQPEVVPVVEGQKDENTEKVVESSPAGETAAFEQNIPVDEKGKKMWEQSTPEYIAEYIRVRKPEDVEAQMSVVSGMIEGLEKQKSKMDAMDAMDIDDKIAFWKKVGELIGGAKDVVDPISQLNAKHSSALTAFNSMLENIRREGNEQKAAIRYEGLENMVAELGKQLPEGYTIGVVDGKYTIVEAQPAETVPVAESAPIEEPPQATNEMQEADLENAEKGEKGQKAVEPVEENKPKVRGRKQVEKAVEKMRKADAEGNALEVLNNIQTAELNAKRGDEGAITPEELAEIDALKKKYADQGYEMQDMTGKVFDRGMRLEADFVIDESLPDGAEVIKSTIKPYIFKDGVMVQKAKVIVAQSPVEAINPIGKGYFGEIYDQFKNGFKAAFDFLVGKKRGEAVGVFNREGIGEIDLVWGDEKAGLSHILTKHVGKGKSFESLEDAKNGIADVVENGKVVFQDGDKVVIQKDGKIVTLRKNVREKGKKIADKNWILTAYDETKADDTSAISGTNKGQAAQPTVVSEGEGTTQSAKEQENTQKSGEIAENVGERMYSQEELAETKEQLGELNATSAPNFAVRLFSIRPWGTLEEANAALKELLASYGETLNGQTAAVLPFLDEAQRLISENSKNQEPRSVEEKTTEDGNVVLYSIAEDAMLQDKGTEAFERATKVTMDAVERLKANGVKVVKATKKMADALIKGSAEGLTADELHELRGVVARGLADAEVKIVRCGNNPFNTKQKTVDLKKEVLGYAEKNGIIGTMSNEETNGKGEIHISKKSIGKFVDDSASDKSVDIDIHLSVLPQIREVIASSIETEVHPDYVKVGKDRSRENGYNKNVLMHRCYGAVNIDGKVYRVKITLKEDITNRYTKAYSYEVTNIELFEGTDEHAVTTFSQQDNSISAAKLLHNIEKSYDEGVKLLEASKNVPDFMTVFHGSGAQFDRFEHSFMGTGEGAQAFGWGTYVTEVEGIGRTYATTMRDKLISEKHKENAIINKLAKQTLESSNGNKEEALDYLRGLLNESWSDKKRVKAQIKIIETGKFLPETKLKANLYTVDIPDDNGSNYLHWEERINGEIQERVANGLQNIGFEIEPDMNHLAYSRDGKIAVLNINAKGKDLYAELSEVLGGDKEASQFLNEMGFVGISYPANATTGGRADGARNYVIFNEGDAVIEDRVEFLRTANGKVYGWAVNGTIYLMPDGINPNTPVHEYAHLWGADVEKNNPKLWNEVVEAMKLSPVWNEVANDANYSNIHGNDSRMASEVLARLSGRENYRRTMEEAQREIEQAKTIEEKAEKISRWAKIKAALKNLWNWVQRNVFRKKENATAKATTEVMPWEEFANSVVGDFYKGKNPNVKESPLEKMAAGEVESKPISRIDLSNGPVRGVNEPEWKFKARREKWRRWVESNTDVKTPMPEKPFLQEGEPIEVYEERMKEFNKALNRWKKDILSKDSEIEEMLNILYDGKVPEKNPTPEDEFTEQVFKRYMGDDGIRVDRKSMRGMIMDEIIERRRKIETNNFDDVVFINEVRKATTAEQRKAIPFIIEGTYNGEVSKELAVVVRRVKDWFENVYQALQAADAMHSSGKIKNYVTHIWDKNRTPKAVYENYINTRSKYTNRRSIDTYAEGIALGMVPKYDDICDIMLEYGHIANEAIANKDFTDFLHMLRVDGEPVLKDVTIRDPMYVRTSSEALDGYKVHKYAKGIVENVLGTVRTENAPEWMQKLAHFYDVSGSLKKKINLSLSFFHHGALLETAVGAMNPAKAVSTVFKNLVWDCMRSGELPALSNPEATRNAVNHLVQLGATQDYMAKEVNRLTGRLKEVLKDFSDKHPNLVTKGVVKPAELLDFLNTGFDKVLWDYLHDGLKIYTFDKYAKEIEEYAKKKGIGDTEKDMLLNEAGQLVNDIYGGQFWELIDVSPAAVKWLRRLLLSPDWTISTIRQALSPIGFGTLYKDYEKNWAQRTVGTGLSASFRRKQGVKFWITALLTFGALMNGLNAWRRKEDVDDELEKAEERRKTDPEYKSPYELKYPDGMKWYDYTMYGNTIGHQTHLFGWRYDDEKEGYIRWGKQFRELPELFLGKDGFSFPGPMIDKMVGKANPELSAGLAFLGYAKDGWQSKWMKDKKGWEKELGRVMMMAASFMPYSIPTDDDKEFVLTDLMMPSSKGFSNNKAIRGFETAILSQDFDYVGAVYDACVMNKLDAEKLLQVAIARVEAQAKAEYVEGANTLNEAWGKYQEDLEINEKRAVRTKLNKLLQENAYKDFTKQETRDMVQSVIDGTYREEKLPEAYIASETAEDVRDAYKMDAIRLRLKKVVDDIPEDAVAYKQYYNDNKAKIDLYDETVAAKREMNLIMEDIKITPQFTEQYMQEIRDIRREIIEMANNLTGNNE